MARAGLRPLARTRPQEATATARMIGKRFLLVAGKGGVGKSTVAAALGVAAARSGLRALVVETAPAATFRPCSAVPLAIR